MTNDMHAIARSNKGFSLIELLIVLAILSIVATLSAPALMSMAPNMALKSAGRDLYAFLQNARVLAVRENRTVTVRFDTPGYYYRDDDGGGANDWDAGEPRFILGEDLDGDGTLDAGEDLDGNVRLDDNYGVALGTGATTAADGWLGDNDNNAGTRNPVEMTSISFNNQGIPTAAATVYLDKSNSVRAADAGYNTDCYAVEVKVQGSIEVHKHNGAVWDP